MFNPHQISKPRKRWPQNFGFEPPVNVGKQYFGICYPSTFIHRPRMCMLISKLKPGLWTRSISRVKLLKNHKSSVFRVISLENNSMAVFATWRVSRYA